MKNTNFKSSEEALVYLTDCTLATVSSLAMKKSRRKHEYDRQINIAQTGVDSIKSLGVNIKIDSRIYKILSSESQQVRDWAKQYES